MIEKKKSLSKSQIFAAVASGDVLGKKIASVSDMLGNRKNAAAAMEVSPDSLQKYIRGDVSPSFNAIANLCLATETDLNWMAYGSETGTQEERVRYQTRQQRLDADRLEKIIAAIENAAKLDAIELTIGRKADAICYLYSSPASSESVSNLEKIRQFLKLV